MSFWKKLIGQTDLTPEEQAKRAADEEEKKRQKAILAERMKEQQRIRQEERQLEKEQKKAAQMVSMERFFGHNPGFTKKTTYGAYKPTFEYVESYLLDKDEHVLSVIQAEYDKTKKREIKGVLIATDKRLIFAMVRGNSQYIEEFGYMKMNGITLARDGFASKELYLDYGRGRKKFDDIIDDQNFKEFLTKVNGQIALFKKTKTGTQKRVTPSASTNKSDLKDDKYSKLEKIGLLKQQGILTEEEFQKEKEKILNS